MVEVNAYKLEDGIVYNEISRLIYNSSIYLLLSNENDSEDICIRKLRKKEDDVYICRIDNDEFDIIMSKFIEKNKDLLND